MRVLIVKLSSLGDVVHTMPALHDIHTAHPGAMIDWVVEPGFAPLVRRVQGIGDVIECALRRWRKAWWTQDARAEWRAFRAQLQAHRYDAVIDLQGLTKSALIARLARGPSWGIGNRTEGSGFERPAAWLVQHPVQVEPHIHALDRARFVAGQALGYTPQGAPRFGLGSPRPPAAGAAPTCVFVHGTSRADKLWPEERWVALGRRVIAEGWSIALPHAGAAELERAQRIASALGKEACTVWPAMGLDALLDAMAATQAVVGVDSGLSHIAVALDLPHVQLYNFATAWRTGPLAAHGHGHQTCVEDLAVPSLDAVWAAWCRVNPAAVP